MENKSNSKKVNVFQIILCIAVVALIITVIIQSRSINSLNKVSNGFSFNENIEPESTMEAIVIEERQPAIQNKIVQDKKREPEQQKDNTNSVQAAFEGTSDKDIEETNDIPQSRQAGKLLENLAMEMQKNPAMESMILDGMKTILRTKYSSLVEVYDVSPEKEADLMDLIVEKQMELLDVSSQISEVQKGNITSEDLIREVEYVNNLYDEKIADLLSSEEFEAYSEYTKHGEQWLFLNEFKNNVKYTGGIQLDKQQEKDLVAAMYIENQKVNENRKEIQNSVNLQDPQFRGSNLKSSLDYQNSLLNGYHEASAGILSDSQQIKLGEYIDSRKSMLDMGAQLLGGINQDETNL